MADLVVSFPGGLRWTPSWATSWCTPINRRRGAARARRHSLLAVPGLARHLRGDLRAGLPQGARLADRRPADLQDHERDPATGLVGKVRMAIRLPAGVGQEHHAAIVRSAQKCAVKKAPGAPPVLRHLHR